MNGNAEMKKAFLRSYCTCDGGIIISSKEKKGKIFWDVRLVISDGNDSIRRQVAILLGEFDVSVVDDGYKHLRTRYRDINSLLNFKNNVGFIEGVKPVKGKFVYLTKNQLLELGLTLLRPPATAGREAGQKPAVECKGKSRPDRTLEHKGSGRETVA